MQEGYSQAAGSIGGISAVAKTERKAQIPMELNSLQKNCAELEAVIDALEQSICPIIKTAKIRALKFE